MTVSPQQLTIRRPDDWHVHLRDGEMLKTVVPFTSAVNGRAIIMPNLVPPVSGTDAAIAYRQRILAAVPAGHDFTPLMTCYLTDTLSASELEHGFRSGVFTAAKLYPAHATTNSHYGVTHIAAISNVLERMQEMGMPLLIHGEVTDAHVDIFDREARFIDRVLEPLRRQFPGLKVVFEHITTREATHYVRDGNALIGATITPQHLMFNRNHMLAGGIRPHLYCLPVLKRDIHQQALRDIVASGHSRFFYGTDTAPHLRHLKEASCGCAGVFSAPVSLAACATVFEQLGALQQLETFCSENGARFYGLPLNTGKVTLLRQPWKVASEVAVGSDTLTPFLAGETLNWQIQQSE